MIMYVHFRMYTFHFYNCVIFTVDPPYFLVQNLRDMTKLEGRMPLAKLINVGCTLKKRIKEESLLEPVYTYTKLIN